MKQKPLVVLHAVNHHSLADTIASALSQFGLTLTDGAEIDISVRNNGAVRMIQVDLPPDVTAPPTHRIRRCDGNRDAWLIIALRPDGTEVDSFGGWTTSYSVDTLLKSSGHLTPKPGDRVELVP